jgi:hypothetical protein
MRVLANAVGLQVARDIVPVQARAADRHRGPAVLGAWTGGIGQFVVVAMRAVVVIEEAVANRSIEWIGPHRLRRADHPAAEHLTTLNVHFVATPLIATYEPRTMELELVRAHVSEVDHEMGHAILYGRFNCPGVDAFTASGHGSRH